MPEKKLPPVHPGEVLREEFLVPMNISQYLLAKSIGVSARRINEIFHEKRSISADTALRLGVFFGTSPEFWLNLQAHYDLEIERGRLGPELEGVKAFVVLMKPDPNKATLSGFTSYQAARVASGGTAQAPRKTVKHR